MWRSGHQSRMHRKDRIGVQFVGQTDGCSHGRHIAGDQFSVRTGRQSDFRQGKLASSHRQVFNLGGSRRFRSQKDRSKGGDRMLVEKVRNILIKANDGVGGVFGQCRQVGADVKVG